jgi:hypothetical protein
MPENYRLVGGYTFHSIRAKAKGIMERREETSLCYFSLSLFILSSFCVCVSMIMMELAEGKDRECWKFLHKWNDEL